MQYTYGLEAPSDLDIARAHAHRLTLENIELRARLARAESIADRIVNGSHWRGDMLAFIVPEQVVELAWTPEEKHAWILRRANQ